MIVTASEIRQQPRYTFSISDLSEEEMGLLIKILSRVGGAGEYRTIVAGLLTRIHKASPEFYHTQLDRDDVRGTITV